MRKRRIALPSVLAIAATLLFVAAPSGLAAPPGSDAEPVPIPGGIQIPDGPLLHLFVPGPEELGIGAMGTDVEPSVITNFRGFSAIAFIAGSAVDADGNEYFMFNDIRVYKGQYVSADGTHHWGTFVFI